MIKNWFTPSSRNNFRARLLSLSGLLVLLGGLLTFNLSLRLLDASPLHILGFTSSVTIDEVVAATNRERVAGGLTPLKLNDTLSDAARRKAANMFEENYWSHNAPSGKSPWYWFEAAGYHYTQAGENLAKDFGSTDRMMQAWMDSPTHRANIVGSQYQEIGVAVVPGTLQGQETVLVVQLFGSRSGGSVPEVAEVKAKTALLAKASPAPTVIPATAPVATPPSVLALAPTPLPSTPRLEASFNTFNVKKTVGIAMLALLMLSLVLDLVIAENRALSRRVGKNWAHLIFINVILILVVLAHAGSILPEGLYVF